MPPTPILARSICAGTSIGVRRGLYVAAGEGPPRIHEWPSRCSYRTTQRVNFKPRSMRARPVLATMSLCLHGLPATTQLKGWPVRSKGLHGPRLFGFVSLLASNYVVGLLLCVSSRATASICCPSSFELTPRLHWLHSRGTSRWSRVHRAPKVVTRSVLANRYCGRYWHRVGPPVLCGLDRSVEPHAFLGVARVPEVLDVRGTDEPSAHLLDARPR